MRAQAAALCLLAHGDCGCNPLPPANGTREGARGEVPPVLTDGLRLYASMGALACREEAAL